MSTPPELLYADTLFTLTLNLVLLPSGINLFSTLMFGKLSQ